MTDPNVSTSDFDDVEDAGEEVDVGELAERLVEEARNDGIELTGPNGLLTGLTKTVLETALEAELADHLGYDRHDPVGYGSGNSRNGKTAKTVLTDVGPVDVEVPRDRAGSFDPKIVPKHRRRLDGFNAEIISLYAKGLTTGEIRNHLSEIYGANVSKDLISTVTDSVTDELGAWQSRPLEALWPVLFIDAIFVKIRDGSVANRPIYVAMGVNLAGERDILGLWVGNGSGEGAKAWLTILTELRNRGVTDVLIACCDGLKGLPDAIAATWPQTTVQLCVVHLMRSTFRYASRKHWSALGAHMRRLHAAPSLSAAEEELEAFCETWGETYPAIERLWRDSWEEFTPFLSMPPDIRSLVYTTNAIESLNARFRRATKARGHFPSEESALKVLYLTIRERRTRGPYIVTTTHGWKQALNALAIHYGERVTQHI